MKTVTRRITRDELGSFNLAARSLLPILAAMAKFTLESLWITGGALRSQLVNPGKSYSRDIDIIFFNRQEKSEAYERDIETLLTSDTGITCLSVKNQARVNGYVDTVRYGSVFESVDNFPDNSVAIGLQLKRDIFHFYVPYGTSAAAEKTIQPTRAFLRHHSLAEYYCWVDRKKYASKLSDWRVVSTPCHLQKGRKFLNLQGLDG